MAHDLADETLAAIMTLHLSVPDAAFSSTDCRSPFARIRQSSSALLLVCKRWMRIATPLLYNTVILRSTAQAQALAPVLKANPDFGRHIKKLRVEGGYGASVEKIIRAASNITDFCMTLELWANDIVKGMCKAMPLMNPNRLVLIALNTEARNNASTRIAQATVCSCIESWSNLTTVVLPAAVGLSDDSESDIIQSLAKRTSLKHIVLTGETYRPHTILNALAAIPSVDRIDVEWSESRNMNNEPSWILLGLRADMLSAEAKLKVRYAPESDKAVLPMPFLSPIEVLPLDPTYRPMESASQEDRRRVWSLVLEQVIQSSARNSFADDIFSDEFSWSDDDYGFSDYDSDSIYDHFRYGRRRRSRTVTCMLVCKDFKTIATQVACKDLTLRSEEALSSFSALLDREPRFAHLVQTVHLGMFNYDAARLKQLLRRLTQVKRLSIPTTQTFSIGLPYHILDAVADGSGDVVERIDQLLFTGSSKISLLGRFRALAFLEWNGDVSFERNDKVCLPALKNLSLYNFNASFLNTVAKCELPCLDTLEFASSATEDAGIPALKQFLFAHGNKIRKHVQTGQGQFLNLVLSHCPKIIEIKFASRDYYGMYYLDAAAVIQPHPSLERIQMPPSLNDRMAHEKWGNFLNSLTSLKFPALRVVSVLNMTFWPTTQREIAKSPWPRIAETLLNFGITMVDGDGMAWRPRLQTTSTRKK